jgi:hypothetical protein
MAQFSSLESGLGVVGHYTTYYTYLHLQLETRQSQSLVKVFLPLPRLLSCHGLISYYTVLSPLTKPKSTLYVYRPLPAARGLHCIGTRITSHVIACAWLNSGLDHDLVFI